MATLPPVPAPVPIGITALLTLLWGLSPSAAAQAPEYPCVDRAGRPVRTIVSDSLPFAAWAVLRQGTDPVIYWNPGRQGTASSNIRLMVFLHECAHHVLGHVGKFSPVDMKREFEREADCWAVQTMLEEERITGMELDAMLDEIRHWTGDLTHQGGEALVITLRRCLAEKTDAGHWFRFLDALAALSPDSLAGIRGDVIPESGDERVRESIINAPGVFGCDIRGELVMVCRIYSGVREGPVDRRYRDIRRILERWLNARAWRKEERNQPDFQQPRVFLAWDDRTGYNLSLVMTDSHKLFFTWSPVKP
ncbi:MAG: hypothetical protein AB7Q69_05490 [Gemmatimonadales bacterium]